MSEEKSCECCNHFEVCAIYDLFHKAWKRTPPFLNQSLVTFLATACIRYDNVGHAEFEEVKSFLLARDFTKKCPPTLTSRKERYER